MTITTRATRISAVVLLALAAELALASCPNPKITDAARVRLPGDSVLIVTHATAAHDARYATKRGLDEAVRFAKQRRIPVVYLHDGSPQHLYLMEDCEPDYWVLSEDGEIKFDIQARHVYVAGGHLELCLAETLRGVLSAWAKQPKRNLVVTFFMDAIYSNGKSFDEADPYYGDFLRFMRVVTHGRPNGEHWPKLSLLETMGVIELEVHEFEYLKKVVPRTLPAGYRVELQLNDSVVKVLQTSSGWKPPTLRFHFVDTAIEATL